MAGPDRSAGIFYGWIVVAAAFVVTFVGFGTAYTFSSFLGPLQQEFGASRASISLVFSLAGFLYFSLGVISGPLADRFGARPLVAIGMALVAFGMVAASWASSLLAVYVAYSIGIGVGVGCAYVPILGVVQRWFVRRRGYASGLAVAGIGVGTLMVPFAAASLIEGIGWRNAYLVLGIAAAILGLLAVPFIIDDPKRRGLAPDNDPSIPNTSNPSLSGLTTSEAIRTSRFWGLYIACLASGAGAFVPFVHLVPSAIDQGIAPKMAALLLGAIGLGSTIGRFFMGNLADRLGRDRFVVAMYFGMSASLALWAIAGSEWALAIFSILFGLFYGGWSAILPALVADHFGGKNVGAIIGALYTSAAIGTLIGPSAAGYLFDISHSYFLPICLSALANAFAGLVMIATWKTPSPISASRFDK